MLVLVINERKYTELVDLLLPLTSVISFFVASQLRVKAGQHKVALCGWKGLLDFAWQKDKRQTS
jgi:hypothetical protein